MMSACWVFLNNHIMYHLMFVYMHIFYACLSKQKNLYNNNKKEEETKLCLFLILNAPMFAFWKRFINLEFGNKNTNTKIQCMFW